jgi:hypothetical protein
MALNVLVRCGTNIASRESRPLKNALGLIFTLAVVCLPLHGQTKESHWGSAALDVGGKKVHLGMTKGEVTDRLAGSTITKRDEDNWVVGDAKTLLGPTLQFTKGSLTFADRYWETNDNDIGEALFGVVTLLNNQGFSACRVTADTVTSPGSTSQRVWISCGEKGILITRNTFDAKHYNLIYERLGTYAAE